MSRAFRLPNYLIASLLGLFVLHMTVLPPAAVAQEKHQDFHPSASPKDDRVVYYSYRDGDPDLFLWDRTTSTEHNLTRTPSQWEIEPRWSPVDERIVFSRGPSMSGLKVTVKDLDTGEEIVIDDGVNATWSRDGSMLAYMKKNTLWVASSTGGDAHEVPVDVEGLFSDPEWSPDGTELFFSHQLVEAGSSSIRAVQVETGVSRIVIPDPGAYLGSPSLSADGSLLVVGVSESGKRPFVRSYYTADATVATDRIGTLDGFQYFPTLAPDGEHVYVESGVWSENLFHVYRVPLRGSGVPCRVSGKR